MFFFYSILFQIYNINMIYQLAFKRTNIQEEIIMTTLFLSNSEIKKLKNFFEDKGIDAKELFDFDGSSYCGRTYVEVKGKHELLEDHEDGIRVIGLGVFYKEDEDY